MKHQWSVADRINRCAREKNPFFATTNLTWAGLESNPGLCDEKPAIKPLTFFVAQEGSRQL